MAQKGAIEAKARKEYRQSAKKGANPIKEKTLNKKLLALYPDNADDIPEIVARIISQEEAARQQQQSSPDPAAVSPGGVPLTNDPNVSSTPEIATPGTSQDSPAAQNETKEENGAQRSHPEEAQQLQDSSAAFTPSESPAPGEDTSGKPSKSALKRAKKAEKAEKTLHKLQQQQQQDESSQAQASSAAESPAPGQEATLNSLKPSKAAAKRAKKAEKALRTLEQQQQEDSQQSHTTTPAPESASGPASSENPEKLSKGAIKRAKKAEKALKKQEQQHGEGQQGLDTNSTPVPESDATPEQQSSQNPVKLSKGAAKRAKKAEKALQQKQQQETGNQQAHAHTLVQPEEATTAEPYAEPAQTVNELFTWDGGQPVPASAPVKKGKTEKAKAPKKEKKTNKKQQPQQMSFDWAEDQNMAVDLAREAPPNSKVQELKAYIGAPNGNAYKPSNASVLDRQLELLGLDDLTIESETHAINDTQEAVLFSADLLDRAPERAAPQYALLGSSTPDPDSSISPSSRRMFLNTNIPFSAFICGVQGSGKSHTTSCLIENCMIKSSALGVLKKPLSTLVLHLGENSSSLNLRPSEAAFLSSPGRGMLDDYSQVSVTVLTSPSNYPNLRALYSQMPNVEVRPFMLQPKHLDVGTILSLMSVDKTQSAPLYMGQVTKILRDMASQTTGDFDYLNFRHRLENSNLDTKQVEFLNQRLDLLESFLDLKGKVKEPNFEAGKVTIIDLSCPFVDSNTACVLFNIGLGMFLQSDLSAGKNIVVDEAHKYMTDTPAAKQLTESLLAIIRQQRHYGVRVIISTQEPTINPRLIDLCSVTVIHRFYSPDWFNALRKHIAPSRARGSRSKNRGRSRPQSTGFGAGESDENSWDSGDGEDENGVELFKNISALGTGEALVFAPSAILGIEESGKAKKADSLFKMKMRKRVTWDGGKSMVCV